MWKVSWDEKVNKQLKKLPEFIRKKFLAWAFAVERTGMIEVRKRAGFHDEPLKGERFGQRSVRLNQAYRVIYVEKKDGETFITEVIEVNKHDY